MAVSAETPQFASKYKVLDVECSPNGMCVASLNSKKESGINLLSGRLFREFGDCIRRVASDESIRVFVVRSADEDFWMAHFDVTNILKLPVAEKFEKETSFNEWHNLCATLRSMPKATIAEVAGRVGGGGYEFASNFDMRFGVRGKTTICHMEVPLGILPGGSGTVNNPSLVGTGRAMEIILGGGDIDSETAEKWGLVNRCFESKELLRKFVDDLSSKIASYPPYAVKAAKEAVLAAEVMPRREALLEGLSAFNGTLRFPEAKARIHAFLKAGGQTRAGENDLQTTLAQLSKL